MPSRSEKVVDFSSLGDHRIVGPDHRLVVKPAVQQHQRVNEATEAQESQNQEERNRKNENPCYENPIDLGFC